MANIGAQTLKRIVKSGAGQGGAERSRAGRGGCRGANGVMTMTTSSRKTDKLRGYRLASSFRRSL